MEEKDFLNILNKYLEGKATRAEEDFINKYYELFDLKPESGSLEDDAKLRLENRIQDGLHDGIKKAEIAKKNKVIYRRLAVAASLLIMISFFSYFNFFKGESRTAELSESLKRSSAVSPGSDRAVLTLANGEKIALNEVNAGVLARQGNVEISKTAQGHLNYSASKDGKQLAAFNTLSTPRGGQFHLILPDGSKVWLNAASSIRFPTSFSTGQREVTITGEVYFEVAKDKRKPFRVFSKDQVVEVLGTHFNINAYEDEQSVRTTLLEGSVRVTAQDSRRERKLSLLLSPGHQATYQQGNIVLTESDTESAVAWKNGYFKFSRENIQTIMRQISRWYNVDVEYRGGVPTDEFVGKISRSSSIEGVLRILSLSNVQCQLEGNKVIINN